MPTAKIKFKPLFLKELTGDKTLTCLERQSGSGKGFPLWQELDSPSPGYAPRFKGCVAKGGLGRIHV
jgi:hypothetical protein